MFGHGMERSWCEGREKDMEGKQELTYQRVVERHLDLWVGADLPIGSVTRSL